MKETLKNIFVLILFFSITAYAEEIKNNEQSLYQIKIILITHNNSNTIEHDKKFINDKYEEKISIIIKNNNCIISNDNECIKYNYDYKLETFYDHKINLLKDNSIRVISHLEWIQNLDNMSFIKLKNGYDFSEDIFDDILNLSDIDIIGSGKVSQYDGFIRILKNKFYTVDLILFERQIMKSDSIFTKDTLVSKKHNILQKIKLNKTTYIDRDNFGLILKVMEINKN